MGKIRIPRKKKKLCYWRGVPETSYKSFPCVPKIEKYYNYLEVEYAIKRYGLTAEELHRKFAYILKDYVIWWHWVRKKHLGIEPQMSDEFQGYWNYFVEKGVIAP